MAQDHRALIRIDNVQWVKDTVRVTLHLRSELYSTALIRTVTDCCTVLSNYLVKMPANMSNLNVRSVLIFALVLL